MYIIVISYNNVTAQTFVGPFPTEKRAREYATTAYAQQTWDYSSSSYTIEPIIVPHFAQVKYKGEAA